MVKLISVIQVFSSSDFQILPTQAPFSSSGKIFSTISSLLQFGLIFVYYFFNFSNFYTIYTTQRLFISPVSLAELFLYSAITRKFCLNCTNFHTTLFVFYFTITRIIICFQKIFLVPLDFCDE